VKLPILSSAAALVLAAAPSAARAQAQPGDTVRLWAGQRPHEGTVVAAAGDSLRVAVSRRDTVAVAWTAVRRLEIRNGREPRGQSMWHGLTRGLGIGAATGAVAGFIVGGSGCWLDDGGGGCARSGRGPGTVIGAAGFGMIGMGVGTVYGALNPRPRWERSRLRPAVGIGAAPDGIAVAIHLRL
jgi:hypothetical protein